MLNIGLTNALNATKDSNSPAIWTNTCEHTQMNDHFLARCAANPSSKLASSNNTWGFTQEKSHTTVRSAVAHSSKPANWTSMSASTLVRSPTSAATVTRRSPRPVSSARTRRRMIPNLKGKPCQGSQSLCHGEEWFYLLSPQKFLRNPWYTLKNNPASALPWKWIIQRLVVISKLHFHMVLQAQVYRYVTCEKSQYLLYRPTSQLVRLK